MAKSHIYIHIDQISAEGLHKYILGMHFAFTCAYRKRIVNYVWFPVLTTILLTR